MGLKKKSLLHNPSMKGLSKVSFGLRLTLWRPVLQKNNSQHTMKKLSPKMRGELGKGSPGTPSKATKNSLVVIVSGLRATGREIETDNGHIRTIGMRKKSIP